MRKHTEVGQFPGWSVSGTLWQMHTPSIVLCHVWFPSLWKMNLKFQLGFRESHKDLKNCSRKGVSFSVTKEKRSAPDYSRVQVFLGHGCAYADSRFVCLFYFKKMQVNHMQLHNFSVLCIRCGIISSPIYLT